MMLRRLNKYRFLLVGMCTILLTVYMISLCRFRHDMGSDSSILIDASNKLESKDEIVIASVICGKAVFNEVLLMIKSAIIFQKLLPFKFLLFSETFLQQNLANELENMKWIANNSFSYSIQNISYPVHEKEFRDLDKIRNYRLPCTSQRLFLPYLVAANISKIIYLDTDIIILNDLSYIWNQFDLMNSVQLVGATLAQKSWQCNPEYHNAPPGSMKKLHWYGTVGINAGVMLMNLDILRKIDWIGGLLETKNIYEKEIRFHEQELMSRYFYHHPDQVFQLSCTYNYRVFDVQNYNCSCADAEISGASLMHGIVNSFQGNMSPFSEVYSVFNEYKLGTDVLHLWLPLKTKLASMKVPYQKSLAAGIKNRLGIN